MREFAPGDRVITPSDEVALVVQVDGPDLELAYVQALNRQHATFSIRGSLCRRWPHGDPRPAPIRRMPWRVAAGAS